jgi:hypothetical protein
VSTAQRIEAFKRISHRHRSAHPVDLRRSTWATLGMNCYERVSGHGVVPDPGALERWLCFGDLQGWL